MLFFVTLVLNNASFDLLYTPLYYRTEMPDSLSKSDRIKLFPEFRAVIIELQKRAIARGKEDDEILKAVHQRIYVTKDALATTNWKAWLENYGR